ncbi:MAG TPA: hypothetical protein GXX72_07380 [Clostridiaceae bacterium]|nr:hypothetical protein [Clostridiaceae bacterium]
MDPAGDAQTPAQVATDIAQQPTVESAQEQQPVEQAYQAPVQQMPPYPPQQGAYPAAQQAQSSQLAAFGKRYFGWLASGILGTKEPMHVLFAVIVPFLTTLIFTLSTAPFYSWHAGGFFLIWFFMIFFVAAVPVIAWLLKTYLLKDKAKLTDVISEYASYFNIIFLFSLFAMIFALAIRNVGPNNFFYVLYNGTPLFILLAGIASIVSKPKEEKKTWLTFLALGFFFILFTFIFTSIQWHAAMNWVGFGW